MLLVFGSWPNALSLCGLVFQDRWHEPRSCALFLFFSRGHGSSHHRWTFNTGLVGGRSRPQYGQQWGCSTQCSWNHGGIWISKVKKLLRFIQHCHKNSPLHHRLTNGSSAVNGCRQNESPNNCENHHNNPLLGFSPSVIVFWSKKLHVNNKQIHQVFLT